MSLTMLPTVLAAPLATWSDVVPLMPVLVLVFGGALLVLLEVATKSGDRAYMPWLTAAIAFVAALLALRPVAEPVVIFGGSAVVDAFAVFITILVCLGLALSALVASGYLRAWNIERGEYYGLLCLSASGMVMLAVSADLLVLFVSLSVMSVSTYALIAFRRDLESSAEAAIKYFILSSFSAALFLYGAALLFTATGEIRFAAIAEAAREPSALFLAGTGLVTVGFAFKLAAVPFHMWAPDVYEGAPTPVVAFMAAGVKAGVFAALVRLLLMGLGDPEVAQAGVGWGHLMFGLCALSMIVGNVMAVVQNNVKRLLGYSWIAHAGYVFLGVTAAAWGDPQVIDAVAVYLFAYGVTAIGAFAVIGAVEHRARAAGKPATGHIDELAGLSRRSPGLAFAMAVFMLSLAGVPPTVGFIAKLEVLRVVFGAAQADPGMAPWLYALVLTGILTSLVGVYYYLRVVVWMYMKPVPGDAPADAGRPHPSGALRVGVAAAVAGVILLGVLPGPLSGWAKRAVETSFADNQVVAVRAASRGGGE
jgi:NADH-quinone oxidoreductase subunit N